MWVTRIMEYIAALLIVIMAGVILANVLMRYFFGLPIQGTNELVGHVYLPAIVFIGYVVAQSRGQSIEADILYSRFPRQIRREVRLVTSALVAVACAGFSWFGLQEALHASAIGKTAPASDVYIAPVYWLVPASFGVLVVLFALDAARAIRGEFDHEDDAEPTPV